MKDPDWKEQERIRRGPHVYVPLDDKHGKYVPIEGGYKHEEWPKMAAVLAKDSKGRPKYPQPELKDFLTQKGVSIPQDIANSEYEKALRAWDDFTTRSVCKTQEQVNEWLKVHG